MARGRPGVKRPQAGQDGKADEHQREGPHLKILREWKFGQVLDVHGVSAGYDIRSNQTDEHHSAADEGIERELHRAVFAPCGTPNRDDEILWDDRDLIENEEQEQIETEEDAVHAPDQGQVEREELVGPSFDVPGK